MRETLAKKYEQLNAQFSRQLVYRIGLEAGFFSEYNNMILAMLYCLDHKIQFKLYSKDANFDKENGWTGFFKPFCAEDHTETGKVHYRTANWRFALKRLFKGQKSAFRSFIPYFLFFKKQLYTQDVFGKCRDVSPRKHYHIPELGIEGNLQDACARLIELTWRYNEETEIAVDHYKKRNNLPEQYIGLHIRGGDKSEEADLLAVDIYIKKAEALSGIRDTFVLTDDYSIIEKLRQHYPEWTFHTLCDTDERGYFHEKFVEESAEMKRNKLIKLFASMDILAGASLFIGTFSSNPGMYLGMRMKQDKVYAVDMPSWRIW
ncbi:hypothetical protein [Parabacteroides sp. PF5-6]|uniref:hypothetical protein n=1 Tax=Parabacteroides sp. PF5-6 TaxID=1742403 RepID=UPI0024070844|nr:hypothetical protein [Parabacteroides sp. PF5-6]MDF9830955.1 hypothetical protein [Parabacteroides sp. PF5-6]